MTKAEKDKLDTMTRILAGEFVRCKNIGKNLREVEQDEIGAAAFYGMAAGVKKTLEYLKGQFGQNWQKCCGATD